MYKSLDIDKGLYVQKTERRSVCLKEASVSDGGEWLVRDQAEGVVEATGKNLSVFFLKGIMEIMEGLALWKYYGMI